MSIKVNLHGMDKRCEERMLTVFKMIYKGQCEQADIESADTVIFDMEGKTIETAWAEFRDKYPDKPVVAIATEPVDLPDAICITKPAKLPELLEALKTSSNKKVSVDLETAAETATQKAASALQSRSPSAAKRDANVSSENYELYFQPDKFLQGKIIEAITKSNDTEKSIFIKCWSDRWIVILPSSDFLLENLKESQIRNLGLIKTGEDITYSEHKLSEKEITEMASTPASEVKVTPINKFIWDVTVRTARGRIPEGISLDELYVLAYWPNLTRLAYIPDALRMSAFWLNQAQSLNNIVSKLGVSLEDAANFFSAASATGALKPAKRQEDNLITPEVTKVDKNKRNVFSALMRKVSRNIKRDEIAVD